MKPGSGVFVHIDWFKTELYELEVVTYSMGNFGGIVAGSQLRTMAQVIQLILLPKGEVHIDKHGGYWQWSTRLS